MVSSWTLDIGSQTDAFDCPYRAAAGDDEVASGCMAPVRPNPERPEPSNDGGEAQL